MNTTKKQDSLAARISDERRLTADERSQLVAILGKGCSRTTKDALAYAVRCVPYVPCYASYQRVHITDGVVSYCAGQSYPDEIRRLRKSLITGRP